MSDKFLESIQLAEKRRQEQREQIDFYFCEIFSFADNDENGEFNTSFVERLWGQHQRGEELTSKQVTALQNIYEGWVCR